MGWWWEKKPKQELLWKATKKGDVAAVRALLKSRNVDVNAGDAAWEGWTPLHAASVHGHLEVVQELMKAGADIKATTKEGLSPLHLASAQSHLDIVKVLVKAGSDLNATTKEGTNPLHLASTQGHLGVVEVLLKAGTDPEAVTEEGFSSLHLASAQGRLEVVNLLMKAGTDFKATTTEEMSPLHLASEQGHLEVVKVLVRAGSDLNATTKEGFSPLHLASGKGHLEIVEVLLKGGAHLAAITQDCYQEGLSPLHLAAGEGHEGVVEVLLEAGADLNATTMEGWTALHVASVGGYLPVVEMLLKAGADPNSTPVETTLSRGVRQTPLLIACKLHQSDLARVLLASGADLHAKDSDGFGMLGSCLRHFAGHSEFSETTLETLQVLVSSGATWDAECDELVATGMALEEAPALRICMSQWSQELADGLPFTDIPYEVISRGADSTQAYIDDRKNSTTIVLRRKICLVGSSCAGKTSLVKSIISKEPQLEHVDKRTIGIDQFPLRFYEPRTTTDGKTKVHEVTFWDFAGQDAYQVAHSLFFSPRTLYLVCVNLEAFTIAYMQAVIFADHETQEINLLDEFVEDSVMRWVRIVVSHQPDAEFVFVTTKEDALADNKVTGQLLKDNLMTKLRHVQATVKLMRDQLEKDKQFANDGLMFRSQMPLGVGAPEPTVVFTSCKASDSVQAVRLRIQDLIIQSKHSFEMTDTYSQALAAIKGIREAAQVENMTTRIHRVFTPVESLPAALNIEPKLCTTILQTLHDLGDVLWYEELGVELFENTVILDPLLLIDFIRQVITHKHTGVTMSHADLTSKRFWMGLSSQEQIKAMKQVLHKFRLVYPDDEKCIMQWNSDLIVPAFWQTKTPAAWKFLGDFLRIKKTRSHENEATRIDWEYHFQFGLPSPLFDHVVVASVSPYFEFDAGPDWIVYEEKEVAACRIMVGRDSESKNQIIHVEAVVAQSATAEQIKNLWNSFEQLCGAFVGVLQGYRGLAGVSCFAYDDKSKRLNLERLVQSPMNVDAKWLPPPATWAWFKQLVAYPHSRSRTQG